MAFASPLAALFIPHGASDLMLLNILFVTDTRNTRQNTAKSDTAGNKGLHHPQELIVVGLFLVRLHAVAVRQIFFSLRTQGLSHTMWPPSLLLLSLDWIYS